MLEGVQTMKGLNMVQYDNKVICQLYDTVVAIVPTDSQTAIPIVKHGGYITMSTTKAINKALAKAGLANWHCYRKLGTMYCTDGNITITVGA